MSGNQQASCENAGTNGRASGHRSDCRTSPADSAVRDETARRSSTGLVVVDTGRAPDRERYAENPAENSTCGAGYNGQVRQISKTCNRRVVDVASKESHVQGMSSKPAAEASRSSAKAPYPYCFLSPEGDYIGCQFDPRTFRSRQELRHCRPLPSTFRLFLSVNFVIAATMLLPALSRAQNPYLPPLCCAPFLQQVSLVMLHPNFCNATRDRHFFN